MRTYEKITADKTIMWNIQPVNLKMGKFVISANSCLIKLPDCGTCSCVWSDNEEGYEHVSIAPRKQFKMPSWEDMAKLKDIFFKDDEEAYQIMPKKSEYVNLKENCLHLWRPHNGKILRDLI